MKWFKNLKIRVKLLTCFIVIALFTGIVGAIGINNMSSIHRRAIDMQENNYLPVQRLVMIQKNLHAIQANVVSLGYIRNATMFKEEIAEIKAWADENNRTFDYYESIVKSEEDLQLFNVVLSELDQYRKIREELIANAETGSNEQIINRFAEFDKERNDLDQALQKLIDYNMKEVNMKNSLNETNFNIQSKVMIGIGLLGVILAIVLGVFIANLVSKPINQLVNVSNKIAAGDLNANITIWTKDEVGMLAHSFRTMVDNLNDLMANVSTAAEQVASGSRQVSDSSMALSQGATEQASSIQQLTASLEEISSQTKLNAQNASQANGIAETAKTNAAQGNERMKQMLKAMDEINESSSSISKIIKVIDEIAFQTNILALNAAVEAARAGQHGKGFAVVAEEVRNLAARSANAAKETTTMIEGSIKKVEDGTKIATETAEALTKIVDGVTQVAILVNEIAVASNEQAVAITQVNQGIVQVSDVVQTNSATSEEGAAASEELSSQAEMLKELVGRFILKKNNAAYYRGNEELNPEVLKMLEARAEAAATGSQVKIALSDKEFGKY